MKRITKVLLWVAGSIFVICLVLAGVLSVANLKNVRKAVADQKICDAHLAQLKRDLPMGTPREEVLRYLQARGHSVDEFGGTSDGLSVSLGKIQSTVWYCSFFIEYAEISFFSDNAAYPGKASLASINPRSIGQCL